MKNNNKTQTCKNCVMDTTDSEIIFDSYGVCNFCNEAIHKLPAFTFTKDQEKKNIERIKRRILKDKKGEYDSILGLSGGVDSSYVAYLAMKMNLNPLCVHFDNGWNSEISVQNINSIIEKTGFDLETYVINWDEFKDLQRSFLFAGVIDIEMLTDHAIFASLFKIRKEHKIKYVLSGTNYATENGLPLSWIWPKMDKKNILAIQKKFGTMKIKSYPTMSFLGWELIRRMGLGGNFLEILNHINYKKLDVMEILSKAFDWKYYGGKHHESIFTKFYQTYILPEKFNVDKRKSHLSALIRNGEIKKEEALKELEQPLDGKDSLDFEYDYVIKKLGFTSEEFKSLMKKPPVSHSHYPNSYSFYRRLNEIRKKIGVKI